MGLFKTTDAGAHWQAVDVPEGLLAKPTSHVDTRPLRRIGGGDLPTLAVDPKDPNTLYSASVVMWRSDDGGVHWSAVRGAYGGDDYQKIWINPNNPDIVFTVSDQGAVVSANRGESWSNWYTQPTAAMYHVTTDNAFPYRVCGGQQDSGSACVLSRGNDGEITFHDWHPVNIQEYGIAAPDPRDPDMVYGSARTDVSLYNRQHRPDHARRPGHGPARRPVQPRRPHHAHPVVAGGPGRALLHVQRGVEDHRPAAIAGRASAPTWLGQTWKVPATAGKYAQRREGEPAGHHHRPVRRRPWTWT